MSPPANQSIELERIRAELGATRLDIQEINGVRGPNNEVRLPGKLQLLQDAVAEIKHCQEVHAQKQDEQFDTLKAMLLEQSKLALEADSKADARIGVVDAKVDVLVTRIDGIEASIHSTWKLVEKSAKLFWRVFTKGPENWGKFAKSAAAWGVIATGAGWGTHKGIEYLGRAEHALSTEFHQEYHDGKGAQR